MDVTRLSRIKNGQYNPTPYEIARLAKILDVSSDYLLGLTNVKVPMDSTTEKESELLQTFREMDENKQNYVLETTTLFSRYQDDKKSK
jgi:transcriptional regulator with XRE-family HTH domain